VLTDRLGAESGPVTTAHACGVVGVQAAHAHYSDGFALLRPLPQGTGVALRRADTFRLAFATEDRVWTPEASPRPPWVRAAARALRTVCADEPRLDVAVASDVPPGCYDGYLASLVSALVQGVDALGIDTAFDPSRAPVLRDDLVPRLTDQLARAIDQPYSTAYLLATFAGDGPACTLVDTATREYLPVGAESDETLEWAIVDPHTDGPPRPPSFHRRRRSQAHTALAHLRRKGFRGLSAFRDLEHRDLDRATQVLPRALQRVARHLVTENRRVQKHVRALRHADAQMVGALLLMAHASLRDVWNGSYAPADALVNAVEARTHAGLYGAGLTDRGGAVLVAGRPDAFEDGPQVLIDAAQETGGDAALVRRV
jgi:galactokinase